MTSKGYKRFKNRLEYFRTDNEVAEILLLNKEVLAGESSIFKRVTHDKHPLLFKRTNTVGSRNIVVSHLRKTIYVAFIKDMYEEVTEYIQYILQQGAMNGADSQRLVGEHNIEMTANDILSKNNKKEIVQAVMSQIFRQLENKQSTMKLLSSIKRKLDLTIDQTLIDRALAFLEIRHIFVHADGKPDQVFLDKYPDIRLDNKERILLNSTFAQEAYMAIHDLILAIDREMIDRNYISASELS